MGKLTRQLVRYQIPFLDNGRRGGLCSGIVLAPVTGDSKMNKVSCVKMRR